MTITNPKSRRREWSAFLLLVSLGIGAGGLSGAIIRKHKAVKSPTEVPDSGELTKPQLLNADSNPTLRYPIASVSPGRFNPTYGWLDVSRKSIRYTVVQPAKKIDEGFETDTNDMAEIMNTDVGLQFRIAAKKRSIFYLPQDRWGSIDDKSGAQQASAGGVAGTASIEQALKNFDRIFTMVKPPSPPPVISLKANPSEVEKGQPIVLSWTSSNAATLTMEPGIGQVPAQGSTGVVPTESTTYVLTVQGPGGNKTATEHVTVNIPHPPPKLIITSPLVSTSGQTIDVTSSPLVISGVVISDSGLPVVTVNGVSAGLRPNQADSATFTSDALILQPGENRFEVVATNVAHVSAKLVFSASYTAKPATPKPEEPRLKPFAKQDILDLLHGKVPSAQVSAMVVERGIKFIPSDRDLYEVRSAGGGDDLVGTLKRTPPTPQ